MGRRRFSLHAVIAAGASTLLAAGLLAPSGAAAAEDSTPAGEAGTGSVPRYEGYVGQFNAWGSLGHYGETEGLLWAVGNSVREREPLALTMQEVCEDQIKALAEDLDEYDYVFEPAWDEPRDPADPDNEDREPKICRTVPEPERESDVPPNRFGNAVLFQEGHGFAGDGDPGVGRFDLRSFGVTEYRSMVCTPSESLDTAVCSTHLTPGDRAPVRENEIQWVGDHTQFHYGDGTVFLGTDLNMLPDEPAADYLYHPDYDHPENTEYPGEGHYRELMDSCPTRNDLHHSCREGEPTHGAVNGGSGQRNGTPSRQIDYLFATLNVFVEDSRVTAPSTNCPNPAHGIEHPDIPEGREDHETISCSDHEMLWVEVAVI